MDTDLTKLNLPPFPEMTWNDCDWWDGEMTLPDDEEPVPLTVTLQDFEESRIPSEAQREAYTYILESQPQIMAGIAEAFRPYYESMRPIFEEYLGEEFEERMPPLDEIENLSEFIPVMAVHIHPEIKDGKAYFGLQLSCEWDDEHGLGVLMHQDSVVKIGEASVHFAESPDDEEEEDEDEFDDEEIDDEEIEDGDDEEEKKDKSA